jgi:Ca2+-binding RTX toxin-like protein
MAKRTIRGTGKKYTGTAGADTLTVVGRKNTVNGARGNDRITVSRGSGHKVYGHAGSDTIIVSAASSSYIYGDDAKGKVAGKDKISINGGKQNAINAGKGTDTITVNGGSSTIYGGKGNDVFVISKNSTGKAVVKDFRTQAGNFDKVRVSGGAVKNIKASGSDRIITGGKSGSLTLKGAKANKFTVTDTNGEYTVSSSAINLVLKKSFTGTFTARSFLNSIDASRVTATGVAVTGNAKANKLYVANVDGGYYYGGGGNDAIIVNKRNNHTIYGDDSAGKLAGDDKITISGGSTGNTIYGGKGNDTITVTAGAHMIYGGEGVDTIKVNSSNNGQSIHGNEAKDYITVSGGNIHSISGDDGDDVISVTGGVNHHIAGGAGKDTITVTNVTFDENSSYQNSNGAYINAGNGGTKTITVSGCKNALIYGSEEGDTIKVVNSQNTEVSCGHGNDTVTISGGNNTYVNLRKGTNRVTVAGRNVTLQQWDYNYYGTDNVTKDIITVNWSNNIGKMTIKTYYPLADAGIDVLTINNAVRSDFKFVKTAAYDLSIQGNNGCSIYIPGWYSTETFKNGITIGGTKVSYADINAAVGFQR